MSATPPRAKLKYSRTLPRSRGSVSPRDRTPAGASQSSTWDGHSSPGTTAARPPCQARASISRPSRRSFSR